MSSALAVYHGPFGRVSLYLLNKEMTTHAHREGHLIFYVDCHLGSVRVRDEDVPVDPGSAAAISPWEPHGFQPFDRADGTLCLVLYIRPDWFLELSRVPDPALRFGRCRLEVTGRIALLRRKITAMLLGACGGEHLDAHLFELTQECFDQSWAGVPGKAVRSGCFNAVSDFRVRRSMKIIREQIGAGELMLNEVARDSGLSRAHFYKLFRKQTGLTPNLFLNTLRMEKAIDGLTTTDRTVTDIGFDLGFASQASFTRFFSSNVGIPPTDYRRIAQIGHA